MARATFPDGPNDIAAYLSNLARELVELNRPEEAAKWRAELAGLEATTQPATRPTTTPSK